MSKSKPSTPESSTPEPSTSESSNSGHSESDSESSKRNQLIRRVVTFQLKLMADGLRDLVLFPVSLVAALIGIFRGGDEPDRELNQVMEYGRQTEEWIDLFEQRSGTEHDESRKSHSLASIDAVFSKVEESLMQSYKSSDTSEDVQSEIDDALNEAHEKARKSAGSAKPEPSE